MKFLFVWGINKPILINILKGDSLVWRSEFAFQTSLTNDASQHFSTPFTFTSPNDHPKRLHFYNFQFVEYKISLASSTCLAIRDETWNVSLIETVSAQRSKVARSEWTREACNRLVELFLDTLSTPAARFKLPKKESLLEILVVGSTTSTNIINNSERSTRYFRAPAEPLKKLIMNEGKRNFPWQFRPVWAALKWL